MQTFDAIAIGDSIVDLLVQLPDKGLHFSVDKKAQQLCFALGEKNPVAASTFSIGGNATHVAIGLSRLGLHTGLAAEIGTDDFAPKILKELENNHVDTSLLVQTPHAQSTFTVSITAGGDRTTLVRHVVRQHHFALDSVTTKWLYLTSMGEKWEDMYTATLMYAQKSGAKIMFNPGSTQFAKGVDSFANITTTCDTLIVNKEEAEEILYKKVLPHSEKESPDALLFRLSRMGPKIVIITDGENGSYAIDEKGTVYQQKAFPVEITEKTGAGDAFSAGFLGAMLAGKDIPTALLWGSANASGVIQKVGGHEGLLTKTEIEERINKNS